MALNQLFTLFISFFLQALPFLLLGILISSWLLAFANQRQLLARLPHSPLLDVLLGSCLGLLLPVCQYGNIPLARRLLIQKFPIPLVISFLLAAPTINPVVIWLTLKSFPQQPEIVFGRIIFAWLIAIIVGCIFLSYKGNKTLFPVGENVGGNEVNLEPAPLLLKTGTFLPIVNASQPLLIGSKIHVNTPENLADRGEDIKVSLFLDNFIKELLEFGSLLVIGSAIAAMVGVFVINEDIVLWGTNNFVHVLGAMTFGFLGSLGAIVNTLTITNLTPILTNGSIIALLLFSSLFDIKTLVLLGAVFRYKEVIYLFILTFQLVSFFGMALG
jgi:uncharacterized membrane protein YraQ (UPF0718 family)